MTSLREWERRPIGADGLSRAQADRLLAVARASPLGGEDGTRILVDGGRYLRAQNVVGVISAEDCTLEILPKIDGIHSDIGVRRRLVHMLAVAHDLDIAADRVAALGIQHETLLEILIRLFTDQLIDAVRSGLPRRYVEQRDDLPALRGRLDVARQFTTFAADATRLACRYDELSPDIALNRILKAAVTRLQRLARRAETQRRLAELAFAYADVEQVPRRDLPWERLSLDRTDSRWRPLVDFARLLLGDRFQTTSAGETQGTALLFDMGMLFETYIARSLHRALRDTKLRVVAQGGLRYCLAELDENDRRGPERFQTRPDILVKDGACVVMVIDTKWKRLARNTEDRKRGVVQADIYQMMAYARLYASSRLTLLYPHHDELGENEGMLRQYTVAAGVERLAIATIDLSDPTSVEMRLRSLVGSEVLPSP
ncbi:restriction endonuclease [Mesorhizobium sp. ISC25]|uniref:McrC family protein n=1 Tax=Mesorhizobium sp. ISC25 TaxID=3077335 RepID=UPI0035DED649